MPVSSAAFYETYSLYRNALKFDKSKPYTYETWSRLDPSYKCAALYCNFFEQITLAWYKVATTWNSDVDGVEEVHKYLLKNVSAAFWKKVELDTLNIRTHLLGVNKQFYKDEKMHSVLSAFEFSGHYHLRSIALSENRTA